MKVFFAGDEWRERREEGPYWAPFIEGLVASGTQRNKVLEGVERGHVEQAMFGVFAKLHLVLAFSAGKYIGDSPVHYQVMCGFGNDVSDLFGFHPAEPALSVIQAEQFCSDSERDDGR